MSHQYLSIWMVVVACLYFATTTHSFIVRGLIDKLHTPFSPCPFSSTCIYDNHKLDISVDLLHRFELMAQYAAAAYCSSNNNSTGTPITCPAGICPLIEAAGAHSVSEFENTVVADNTGFIAVDDVNRLVVLTFRGSVSRSNWVEDRKLDRVHTDLCRECHIHRGFWESWVEVRDTVRDNVKRTLNDHKDYRLAITGHSLGGAIATLAAADLRKDNNDLAQRTELFTYGSPRVGNMGAASFLSRQSTHSYRITSMNDPIPRQPGTLLNYFHTSPEYWIDHNPDRPRLQDIKVLKGYLNPLGNSGTSGMDIDTHRRYFSESISKCS